MKKVHEEHGAQPDTKLLGWRIAGEAGELGPAPERVWRCRFALEELLRRGKASGHALQRIVGHITFLGLVRRESLAIFASVYQFMQAHPVRPAKLWPSVARELRIFCQLLPLLWQDLRSEWSDVVVATDASKWGLGVVQAQVRQSTVARVGRLSER